MFVVVVVQKKTWWFFSFSLSLFIYSFTFNLKQIKKKTTWAMQARKSSSSSSRKRNYIFLSQYTNLCNNKLEWLLVTESPKRLFSYFFSFFFVNVSILIREKFQFVYVSMEFMFNNFYGSFLTCDAIRWRSFFI